jgi:hypothetical protein
VRTVEGFVFYHRQDLERAAAGDGLFLAYGALEDSSEAAASVGNKIVGAMRKAGLRVEWNGDAAQRISVTLDWKRRRRA